MSNPIRLAVIGAGSAQFSLAIVRDICLATGLYGSTITFMDIDQERLDTVSLFAERYAREMGIDLHFEKTMKRQEALMDADFVIHTALAGGHEYEEAERAFMKRQGYWRGVELATVYRQFDLMLSVAKDMERYCPAAWLILAANPVFEGGTLLTRETNIKVVGLCSGPLSGIQGLAHTLSLEPERISFEALGFNHCVWLTYFRYNGEDAYSLLDHWIKERSRNYWRDWRPTFAETQMSPAAIHMYQFYDMLPLGDTSRGLLHWWYHLDQTTKERWWGWHGGFDSDRGWADYLRQLECNVQHMYEAARDTRMPVTDAFPPQPSNEQIIPIIEALAADRPGRFFVNIPNHRSVLHELPTNVVVEVPALVDGDGIHPQVTHFLPERIMLGVMWPLWIEMERQLAAYLTGDRRYLMDNLLTNRNTRTWEQAERGLNALLSMPGNEAMAQHFAPGK